MNKEDQVAERVVLGIILHHPSLILELEGLLDAPDFFSRTNRAVYKSITHLLGESAENLDGVDSLSIRMKAIELGFNDFDQISDNGAYVDALFSSKVSKRNLLPMAKRIKDLSIKRSLRDAVSDVNDIVLDDDQSAVDMISQIENKLQEAVNRVDHKNEVQVLGADFLDWVNSTANDPRAEVGLSSGYQRYDAAIGGGFRRGSVSLVAARPKNFKSGFGLNVAKNLSVGQDVPTLILDTELTTPYQMARLGASVSGVPINHLETGRWRSKKIFVDSVQAAYKKIKDAPLYHVYVGGNSIEKTLSIMRYWLTKHVGRNNDGIFNDCLIVYDYIKLMNAKEVKSLAEWQVLGFQMTSLHDFVTIHDIPLLLFAQLNREGGIAAADRLIWFCSNFSVLARKSREEIEEDGPHAGNLRISTSISRHGPAMDEGDYLNLNATFACMQLREGRLKSELNPDDQYEKTKKDADGLKGVKNESDGIHIET